jgi:Rieske Fe-S protein
VLAAIAAGTLGLIAGVAAVVPGATTLFLPLFGKKKTEGRKIRVALLAAIPPDGVPRPFPVIAERVDQWSRYPREKIGEVFLVLDSAGAVPRCFTATCPHLGCAVDFKPQQGEFRCPCHTSAFAVDGSVISGPSPRPLDTLEVEVRDGQVYVDFKKFRSVLDEKVPE